MFLLRFVFRSALLWAVARLAGRFFPQLGRILRVLRR
jgi:hypothetical protein